MARALWGSIGEIGCKGPERGRQLEGDEEESRIVGRHKGCRGGVERYTSRTRADMIDVVCLRESKIIVRYSDDSTLVHCPC